MLIMIEMVENFEHQHNFKDSFFWYYIYVWKLLIPLFFGLVFAHIMSYMSSYLFQGAEYKFPQLIFDYLG